MRHLYRWLKKTNYIHIYPDHREYPYPDGGSPGRPIPSRPHRVYSYRNASTGFNPAARRAGR